MAWTAPKTWSVSEVVTAANMNLHVRDNLNYLKGNAGAVVISDEIQSVVAAGGSLLAQGTNNSSFARYRMLCKDAGGAAIDWRFLANGTGASEWGVFETTTERMRIAAGGNVGINYTAPQGKLHVGGAGGGVLYLSVAALAGTLVTPVVAGTVTRSAFFWLADHNNTTNVGVLNFNGTQIAVGGSNTITNTDTITVAVTAGGAITVQRTAGSNGTHNLNGWVVYS